MTSLYGDQAVDVVVEPISRTEAARLDRRRPGADTVRATAAARVAAHVDPARVMPVAAADADAALAERLERAWHLFQERRVDEALALARDLAWQMPSPAGAKLLLSRCFINRREYDRALDILASIPDAARTPEIRYYAGLALARLGKNSEALAELARSRSESTDPHLRKRARDLQIHLGERDLCAVCGKPKLFHPDAALDNDGRCDACRARAALPAPRPTRRGVIARLAGTLAILALAAWLLALFLPLREADTLRGGDAPGGGHAGPPAAAGASAPGQGGGTAAAAVVVRNAETEAEAGAHARTAAEPDQAARAATVGEGDAAGDGDAAGEGDAAGVAEAASESAAGSGEAAGAAVADAADRAEPHAAEAGSAGNGEMEPLAFAPQADAGASAAAEGDSGPEEDMEAEAGVAPPSEPEAERIPKAERISEPESASPADPAEPDAVANAENRPDLAAHAARADGPPPGATPEPRRDAARGTAAAPEDRARWLATDIDDDGVEEVLRLGDREVRVFGRAEGGSYMEVLVCPLPCPPAAVRVECGRLEAEDAAGRRYRLDAHRRRWVHFTN